MTVKETIMKKLLTSAALALALTAAGMTSYAVNWVYLGQDGNDRIYYDTSSVSRQGNLVAVTMQEREADGEAEEYNYLFDTHRKKYTLASKIEYDRESTNSLNELAIRKGLPKMHSLEESGKKYHISMVPDNISDDYSYLYLCRLSAAKTNYLLSRIFVFYAVLLGIIICIFTACIFWKQNTADYLKLIIGFYPLINPFIKNCSSCKKTQKNCVKICADIDNFFADGDASVERLARFYYYTQNIEFEMMVNKPAIYNIFPAMFKRGLTILEDGVTIRFVEAIDELYGKSKGLVGQARGKALITRVDYDLVKLEEKENRRKKLQSQRTKDEISTTKDSEALKNKVQNTPKSVKAQPTLKKTVANIATKPKLTKTTTSTSKSTMPANLEKAATVKKTVAKPATKKTTTKPTSNSN